MTLIRSQYLGRLCPLLKSTRKTLLEVTTHPTGAITSQTAGALATTPATLDYALNGGVILFLVAHMNLKNGCHYIRHEFSYSFLDQHFDASFELVTIPARHTSSQLYFSLINLSLEVLVIKKMAVIQKSRHE
jgi:hypothetical protein